MHHNRRLEPTASAATINSFPALSIGQSLGFDFLE
jgi:hypothetical protein